MITQRTKVQLMVFVLITLLGVSYVGAKYARLDRLFLDTTYAVTAHLPDSGGLFAGAEVTYRGITVGRVGSMKVTEDGVDARLDIDNDNDDIPAQTRALVGNRSAVGEQYIELQPESDGEPYLENGSEIEQSNTAIPLSTVTWLTNTQELINSVPKDDLRTVVSEFGTAFQGRGDDLGKLIDSSTSFIETATTKVELTQRLLRDSNVVLSTQLDKSSAIRSFARDLALVSDTLVSSDDDLRRVIANGGVTANTLRRFLEDNKVDLAKLLNNLVVTGEVQVKHLDGIEMVMILYPYTVAGGFVVNTKAGSVYDAHFGMILTENNVCRRGYDPGQRRSPEDGSNRPMDMDARCAESIAQSNARGSQNAPRVAPNGELESVATYDRTTGTVTFADDVADREMSYAGGASEAFGKESWKWLLLEPVMQTQ